MPSSSAREGWRSGAASARASRRAARPPAAPAGAGRAPLCRRQRRARPAPAVTTPRAPDRRRAGSTRATTDDTHRRCRLNLPGLSGRVDVALLSLGTTLGPAARRRRARRAVRGRGAELPGGPRALRRDRRGCGARSRSIDLVEGLAARRAARATSRRARGDRVGRHDRAPAARGRACRGRSGSTRRPRSTARASAALWQRTRERQVFARRRPAAAVGRGGRRGRGAGAAGATSRPR